MDQCAKFFERAALLLAAALVGALAVIGMGMTAQLRAPEKVRYVTGSLPFHLLGTAAVVLAALLLAALLVRFARIRLTGVMMLVWTLLTAAFLLGCYTRQEVDFMYVCDAARAFARGDYAPMHSDYFNVYSYQLGTCFLLEGVIRLVPQADVELVMQALNAVMSIAAAGVLSALGRQVFAHPRIRQCAMALYLLCLPLALYGIHVYGTLPMILLSAAAMLCFVWLIRSGKHRFGLLYVVCIAWAYTFKMNAAIVLLTVILCAELHAMEHRRLRALMYALLGAAAAVLLQRLVIAQYEWRSGVTLREDVSMLARLVMGLQDGKRAAGWYNGYTEQFFSASVSAAQEKAAAAADLSARLGEMAADPVRTLIFFVQKALSQWLEPTYGTLLYGSYCRQAGPLAEAAQRVFGEESTLRIGLEAYMKIWQQALYGLSAIGLIRLLREKQGAVKIILPVAVLGGFLYHMIFEAKSQYIYVYALLLVPAAAYGLCIVGDWLGGRRRRAEDRESR